MEKFGKKAKRLFRMRPFDWLAVAGGLCAVVGTAFCAWGPGESVELIVSAGAETWLYPIDATETICVNGPLGQTIVELQGEKCRVLSSPCPNQNCVAAGAIAYNGQTIACLPNRVLVAIRRRGGQAEFDGLSW